MSPEPPFVESENLVADLERRDAFADRLDHSRELAPENRCLWSEKSAEESNEERLGGPEAAVRPIHRGHMNLDEHRVVRCRRLVNLCDSNHFRRAIPGVDGGPHLESVATRSIRLAIGEARAPP